MNGLKNSWGACDHLVNAHLEIYSKYSVEELRKIAKQRTGADDNSCTYWDFKMQPSEKRVILQAAGLPVEPEFIGRKFKDWTPEDQRLIKQAAKRASDWAACLEVV